MHRKRALLTGLLFLSLSTTMPGCNPSDDSPLARQGTLVIPRAYYDREPLLELTGEWSFCAKEFVSPETNVACLNGPKNFLQVPAHWDEQIVFGEPMPAMGHGTYHLILRFPDSAHQLSVRFKEMSSAYQVWINGKKAATCGKVGTSPETETPLVCDRIVTLPQAHLFTITVWVSNYTYIYGGMFKSPVLGTLEAIRRESVLTMGIDLMILGALMVIAIYHFGIFFFRQRHRSPLFFSLMTLDWGVKVLFNGTYGRMAMRIWPEFPFESVMMISHCTVTISVPICLLFFFSLFPREVSYRLSITSLTIALVTCGIIAATRVVIHEYIFWVYYGWAFYLSIYAFGALALAIRRKREGAKLILFGWCCFFCLSFVDLLTEFDLVRFPQLGQTGLLIMAMANSFALSKRFSYSLTQSEKLTSELEIKNLELKDKILLEHRLEKQRKKTTRASLQMLRYQLNPHFLFNALASIRGAIHTDRDAARKMLTTLAEFCRLTLDNAEHEMVTVAQELSLVQHYLDMESIRMGPYLTVSIASTPRADSFLIPSFILQPLAENAVKHGKQSSPDTLRVDVSASTADNGSLSLKISNTGTWVLQEDEEDKNGFAIGLRNTRQRLATAYPRKHRFSTAEVDGRVVIEIKIDKHL